MAHSFSYLEPVCCSMSPSNCCFLTCIQISQEAGQVVWHSHLLKNFPQFVVIHTVKGFGIVNKVDVSEYFSLKLLTGSDFPGGSDGKASAYNAGDSGSIPVLGRSPGKGNGNPLQYSCLENSLDRGAWRAIAHGTTKVKFDLETKPPPQPG